VVHEEYVEHKLVHDVFILLQIFNSAPKFTATRSHSNHCSQVSHCLFTFRGPIDVVELLTEEFEDWVKEIGVVLRHASHYLQFHKSIIEEKSQWTIHLIYFEGHRRIQVLNFLPRDWQVLWQGYIARTFSHSWSHGLIIRVLVVIIVIAEVR